jgi:hypothetical protein
VARDVTGLPNPYLGLQAFTYAERERFAGARTPSPSRGVAD